MSALAVPLVALMANLFLLLPLQPLTPLPQIRLPVSHPHVLEMLVASSPTASELRDLPMDQSQHMALRQRTDAVPRVLMPVHSSQEVQIVLALQLVQDLCAHCGK